MITTPTCFEYGLHEIDGIKHNAVTIRQPIHSYSKFVTHVDDIGP